MATPIRLRSHWQLVRCGTPAAVLFLLLAPACTDAPTRATTGPWEARSHAALGGASGLSVDAADGGGGVSTQGALEGRLPSTDTVTSGVPAFEIKQKGSGIAGRFEITNPSSAAIALDGVSSGTGHALLAWNLGLGRGAVVITSNSSNTLPALDVSSQSLGTSTLAAAADIRANNSNATAPAANISTLGLGPAGKIEVKNANSAAPALQTHTTGLGNAARFQITNTGNRNPAVAALTAGSAGAIAGTTTGTGQVLWANHAGPSGDIAVFKSGGANRIRFNKAGRGFFSGGTQTGGADVAEAFEVEGSVRAYGPGDVLVISTRKDRTVEKSETPYSTRVVGVYATKPGVLLTERDIDDPLSGMVPLGVVGVIPTKVSAENGAIRRGDLLVTAPTPGHAMRGTARDRMLGAVLGKALAEFRGPGTGVIRVLVNVQ